MAHEDVDVAGLHVFIAPDHRMVAHGDGALRRVGAFVHAGEHAYVRARRAVESVPLLVLDTELARKSLEDRVVRIFHLDGARGELGNVVLPADGAHEAVEPGPDRVPVEFAEQRGVMEPDPAAAALLDIALEGRCSRWLPTVRRIVELDEEAEAGEELIVDPIGILDVLDIETNGGGLLGEPDLSRVHKGPMQTAVFGKSQHMEARRLRRNGWCVSC